MFTKAVRPIQASQKELRQDRIVINYGKGTARRPAGLGNQGWQGGAGVGKPVAASPQRRKHRQCIAGNLDLQASPGRGRPAGVQQLLGLQIPSALHHSSTGLRQIVGIRLPKALLPFEGRDD